MGAVWVGCGCGVWVRMRVQMWENYCVSPSIAPPPVSEPTRIIGRTGHVTCATRAEVGGWSCTATVMSLRSSRTALHAPVRLLPLLERLLCTVTRSMHSTAISAFLAFAGQVQDTKQDKPQSRLGALPSSWLLSSSATSERCTSVAAVELRRRGFRYACCPGVSMCVLAVAQEGEEGRRMHAPQLGTWCRRFKRLAAAIKQPPRWTREPSALIWGAKPVTTSFAALAPMLFALCAC